MHRTFSDRVDTGKDSILALPRAGQARAMKLDMDDQALRRGQSTKFRPAPLHRRPHSSKALNVRALRSIAKRRRRHRHGRRAERGHGPGFKIPVAERLDNWFESKPNLKETLENIIGSLWEQSVISPSDALVAVRLDDD
jgi:hypothetical protein